MTAARELTSIEPVRSVRVSSLESHVPARTASENGTSQIGNRRRQVAGDGLFGPLFGNPDVDREIADRAWLQALLDVERGLAAAQARAGLVPRAAAEAIAECCTADRFDAAGLGRQALAAGNPVVPLVTQLRAIVPAGAERHVHAGATSQDILDTAMMLVTCRALGPIVADLRSAADRCAELAAAHAGTVMAGRTLLQQALPITFGLKCAGWLAALDEAASAVATIRAARLAVQFGGAAGTAASLGDAGITVARMLAAELRLAEPVLPWHTNRARVAEVGCALGIACGSVAKIALDVLLLAQTEVAEAREAPVPGRGGSSTLPHKQNPVDAVLITACSRRLPGLAATLLATMPQEHERGAGGWHAEWQTLTEILHLTGGAARRGLGMLRGLHADAERMFKNVGMTEGLIMTESIVTRLSAALGRAAAQNLVTRAAAAAAARGQPVRQALAADPEITRHLSASELDAALDPAGYLGAAAQFIGRALAAHRKHAEHAERACHPEQAEQAGQAKTATQDPQPPARAR